MTAAGAPPSPHPVRKPPQAAGHHREVAKVREMPRVAHRPRVNVTNIEVREPPRIFPHRREESVHGGLIAPIANAAHHLPLSLVAEDVAGSLGEHRPAA